MAVVLALLPMLTVLVLLLVFRQSAVRSGLGGLATAVFVAAFSPAYRLETGSLFQSLIQGVLTSSVVAYVLFFGILLYHFMEKAGAVRRIASFVSRSTWDPVRQVLLLAVAFSPLVESVSGFGVAVIVVGPLLTALGFRPLQAAILALLSMSAVPWGALATGTLIGAELGEIPLAVLGKESARISIPTFLYFTAVSVYVAGGIRAVWTRWTEWLPVSLVLAGSVWLFNVTVSVELAGVLGSFAAMAAAGLLFRTFPRNAPVPGLSRESRVELGKAVIPYLLLTVMLLITRLVPSVKQWVTDCCMMTVPGYAFSLPVVYSPGFALLLTCLFSMWWFRLAKVDICRSLVATFRQWGPVILSTVAFVAMSEVMVTVGMIGELSRSAASLFGASVLGLAPVLGGLGGYLIGSNTGSNAMFMPLQVQTAHHLHMSPEAFAVGQNTGSSHLTMASPSRVLLAASVCGVKKGEERLSRHILMVAGGAVLLLMAGVWWSGWTG